MAKRALQFLLICFLILDARVIYVSPSRQLLALAVTGESKCTFSRTMESQASVKRLQSTAQHMEQASRLVQQEGDLQLWDTPRGRFWMIASAPTMSSKFALVLSEQENRIYGQGEHFVQKGDIVLDCGADYGTFTRSALAAGAAVVVSIEPTPRKEICLRRTFENEIRSGQVIIVPKGVWNKADFLKLYDDSIVQHKSADGPVVPLVTIDQMVKDLNLPRVDFIKMDIEGAEMEALQGAVETVRRFHPRMAISLEHRPSDVDRIPDLLHRLWPDYVGVCGECTNVSGIIQPEVLFAHSR